MARRDLVPLATHDTKRGADTRARISLLSADAETTIATMARWSGLVAPLRRDACAPDALDEWLILETLFGAWPISAERLSAYLVKAMREAKRKTRWEAPDDAYEGAVLRFARVLVDDEAGEPFRRDLEAMLQEMAPFARIASIGQLILQLTVPGIPDTYQGTEFWDHSLVDPDNRRPVDWTAREEALAGAAPIALADDAIGLAKFHVLRRLLALHRRRPHVFEGAYEPVLVDPGPARFIAFRRRSDEGSLLVAVPTRPTRLREREILLGLPLGGCRNVLTDGAFEIGSEGLTMERGWPFLIALEENGSVE
jgi:(1->4)-alpha-D-glucan 1-alpha-D-glucosylmutase